jgi:adenylosuccinate synthase
VGSHGVAVFEGAQGVLLDEWRGFHPHTTWSTIHTDVVESAAQFLGITAAVVHIGVMRSYLTRHGCGPLPSFCASLNGLDEPHNLSDGWQGAFRRGQPDSLLLRYGVKAIGNLSALAVSHLDVFERHGPLRWVQGYQHIGTGVVLSSIPFSECRDLEHQAQLARKLAQVAPVYAPEPTLDAAAFLEQVQALSRLPVWMHSSGPSAADVRVAPTLAHL